MRFPFVRPEICPWVSRFPTSGFLQIPPHDGHPCLRLYPSHYRADSGLSPVRNVRRQAHEKKTSAFLFETAEVCFSFAGLVTRVTVPFLYVYNFDALIVHLPFIYLLRSILVVKPIQLQTQTFHYKNEIG